MSLLLTDEQKMIRDLAKNFATKKVAPLAAEMDLTGEIHPDLIQELADVGTEWFEDADREFHRTPDLTDCTTATMPDDHGNRQSMCQYCRTDCRPYPH